MFLQIFSLFWAKLSFFSSFSSLPKSGMLPSGWDSFLRNVQEFSGLPPGANGVEIFNRLVLFNFIPIFRYIFLGVALLFLGIYIFRLVTTTGSEEEFTTQRKNLLFSVLGFVILGLATEVARIFDPMRNVDRGSIASQVVAESVAQKVIIFMEIGLGTIAIITIFYIAFLMLTSQGDDEQIGKAKVYFQFFILGFVVVMLADPLVKNVFYPNLGERNPGTPEFTNFVIEITAVLKFFLVFGAIIVFTAFIASGIIFLISAGNQELQDRAKSILIWTAVGILLIVISYAVVSFFIPNSIP
jgi:cytochrome bd-type quinol oxidase subunit 2